MLNHQIEPVETVTREAPLRADILVVDDTPDNLRVLCTLLERQGHCVRKALSGEMALTAVKAAMPDLILLDIMMPIVSGYEVCKALKADPVTANVPVIFLSALNEIFDKVKAFNVGGADYIAKPFQFEEVLIRVNHQLALRAAEQEIRHLNHELEQRVSDRTRQLELVNTQLFELAFYDPLTGLPNRVLFMQRLEQTLATAQATPTTLLSVLFLDCDRFKIINDSLGHSIGDQLLIALTQRLTNSLTPKATLARFGGDEFAILLPQIEGLDSAIGLANHILKDLAQPFHLGMHDIFVNVSIGIVISNSQYEQAEQLMRDADTAMYRAKSSGKGHYRVFEAAMHAAALQRMQLETDLQRALTNHELQVYYQPIVELETGAIASFEALLRWQHPTKGIISPTAFIPIAEETGLIVPIGNWVLQAACHQLRQWQQSFSQHLTISVNVSARQFVRSELIEQIDQILAETQLSPACLKLEITESAIMDDSRSAAVTLQQLRDRQIQISIDDFGTGYSSLSYLHSFPVDTLKIDRSFIHGIDQNSENLGLVPVIINIAKTTGMTVVAEGIETARQLTQLRELKCEFGQGYFFAKPLTAEAAEALLIQNLRW